MSQAQTLKTAIHELAHSVMHDSGRKGRPALPGRATREVQAESVAFIVFRAGWARHRRLQLRVRGRVERGQGPLELRGLARRDTQLPMASSAAWSRRWPRTVNRRARASAPSAGRRTQLCRSLSSARPRLGKARLRRPRAAPRLGPIKVSAGAARDDVDARSQRRLTGPSEYGSEEPCEERPVATMARLIHFIETFLPVCAACLGHFLVLNALKAATG